MQTMKVLMGMYNVTVNFKTFIHPNLTPVVSFFHDIKDIVMSFRAFIFSTRNLATHKQHQLKVIFKLPLSC